MKKYTAIVLALILVLSFGFYGCKSPETSEKDVTPGDSTELLSENITDISSENTEQGGEETTKAAENPVKLNITVNTQKNADGFYEYAITSGGAYLISEEVTDTMLVIDADNADVTIILSGAVIKNSMGPAIYVRSGDKVTLVLDENTVNEISDGSSYSISDNDSELDAAIFSKADFIISGNGSLVLNGNCKHGIVSKDDLIISSGTIDIKSKNVGLNGKDCVEISGGNISIDAGSDGIRSDNDKDSERGYVKLSGGMIDITASNDGIQAETIIDIDNADLKVRAGGGSEESLSSSEESFKGLKAVSAINIKGGTIDIDSTDDCVHSNDRIEISGGTLTLSSGDDGIHADNSLDINGSSTKLNVNKSYEGLEATNIVISGGDISVYAKDDGINAAGGRDSGTEGEMRPGKGGFGSSNGSIEISAGKVYINMSGDGLDANGSLSITGGSVLVSGADSGDTSIIDYDTTGVISGGIFIGTGSDSMAQNFDSDSSQGVIMVSESGSNGTAIELTDSEGNVLISYTADRDFSCVIISCDKITDGSTYTLTVGSQTQEITMSGNIYGSGGFFGGGRGGKGFGERF